jgi:hypothetical protein
MDPITIIVTALALGAAAGLKPTAERAIKDAYGGLKALVLRKYGKQGDTPKAVEAIETKPDSEPRKGVLKEELAAAGADRDQELVDKATELLKLLEDRSPGMTGGLVDQINAAGGKVVVVGINYGPITM